MSDPFELYQLRRAGLSRQLTEPCADASRQALQRALLQTDATAAAVYDLSIALRRAATAASLEAGRSVPAADDASAGLARAIEVLEADAAKQQHLAAWLAALGQLQQEAAVRSLHLRYLQWTLLGAVGETWSAALQDLYGGADRAGFFARLGDLVEFGGGRMPAAITEVFDCVLVALEASAWEQLRSGRAEGYLRSLESYSDAANLWLAGVLSFCLEVERLSQGAAPATAVEVQERIRAHVASVVNGTHPVSASGSGATPAGAPAQP